LFSVALWPWVIWAAWSLSHAITTRRDELIAVLVAFALLIPVPYVLVNASQDHQMDRSVTLLGIDPLRSASGWEAMAGLSHRENHQNLVIPCLRHAVALDPDPRYKISLGDELRAAGKLADAETLYVAAAGEDPECTQQMLYLCMNYLQRGDTAKVISLLTRMTELDPGNPALAKYLKDVEKDVAQ